MGRTIAMKLTDKEERIINRLNRAGVSNSEILRDALWKFFKTINEEDETLEQHSIQHPAGNFQPMLQEYITHLKEEINLLREQNISFQQQIGEEITRLHGQLYRISHANDASIMMPLAKNAEVIPDIHQDIDNFLLKRDKKE